MDRFRYLACPWGNFQWLHDGLRHLRLNRLLERRHQSAFYLTVDFASGAFRLDGNLWAVLAIVVASLPLVCSIANIMLANNLRDLDTDIENHRYTLVYYIGRPSGIVLFQVLALAGYLVILFGFISGIYQWPVLITFATLPVIWKNIQTFKQELPQPKVSPFH